MSTSERSALTAQEVADELGVTIRTVRRWIKEGLLPSWRLPAGRGVRVSREALDALRDRDAPAASPTPPPAPSERPAPSAAPRNTEESVPLPPPGLAARQLKFGKGQ